MLDMPYFMTNEDWFRFDSESKKFVLTDNAPKKAKESYEKYYKDIEKQYGK